MLISGDFNLPNIPWESLEITTGANENAFINSLNDHFLLQLNSAATRGNNVLDLVITSIHDQVNITEVLTPEETGIFTDHCIIIFEVASTIKAPPKIRRLVYDFRRADFQGLCSALRAVDLTSVMSDDGNLDDDWHCWKDTFLAAVSDHIPTKKLKGRNPLPWINGPVLDLIKKKETIRQKLKSSPTNYMREKFKRLRSEIKRMLREGRDLFFGSLEADLKNNPKRFWSLLKLRSKSRNIPNLISMASDNNDQSRISADNPSRIADLFNRYFVSVFSTDNIQQNSDTIIPDITQVSSSPTITDLSFTTQEVLKVLESLDVNKAIGPDEISPRLLKATATEIAPSLCVLFNKSLQLGTLPTDWKLANITPVYKKGNKEYTENYRPISLLSQVSKVMERCIFNNIRENVQSLIHTSQHGFISGKSCVTQLVEVLDYIGSKLDRGGQIDVIYLDMAKAFDKVNHELMIRKLHQFGFRGNLLNWFRSYLEKRKQRVTVLSATSCSLPITSGVPQGSILGPMLFLIYANTLPDAVCSSKLAAFADDTKLFKLIERADDVVSLQDDLNNLVSWSADSGLPFNKSKCKHQQISRKKIHTINNIYELQGTPIEITKVEHDLGVWISFDLTWKKQVYDQCARSNKLLGFVRRNTRNIHSISVRKTLYLALVRSNLGYATQIWAPQSIELIKLTERIQRRATKFILDLPFLCDPTYKERLQSLSLLPICYWHEYLDLTFFFKAIIGLVEVNKDVLPEIRPAGSTRSSSNPNICKFHIRKCKTTTFQQSYFNRTPRIWNVLADEMNLSMTLSLPSFKLLIFKYYFTSLTNCFIVDDPRTWKTICPKCNYPRSLTQPISCCY